MTDNPLMKYFRTVEVYQSLATGGAFDPENFEFTVNNELAIYPMTAKDEIILKNPEALLNGESTVQLVKSCVPGIQRPMDVSIPDMDMILLAIKLASSGDDLDLEVKCPECGEGFTATQSIRQILETAKPVDYSLGEVRINKDLIAYLRPHNYRDKTLMELASFEENKLANHLMNTDLSDEEKRSHFNAAYEKISFLSLEVIASCILKIVSPEGEITDEQMIKEYILNTNRNETKMISDALKKMSEGGIDPSIEVTCPNVACGHEWTTEVVYDHTRFFE